MITEKYPQGIFCAIETSGDGAVNVYSRVQMMLFKARLAAKDELSAKLKEMGVSLSEVKAHLRDNWWRRGSLWYPKHGDAASTAANVVEQVAAAVKKSRVAQLLDFGRKVAAAPAQMIDRVRSAG